MMPLKISSKRPRSLDGDEIDHDISGPVGKRQCSLPLRTSPSSSPRRSFTRKPSPPGPYTVPPTLTPVDSSDDDVEEQRNLSLSALDTSQPSSAGSFLSTRANASEGDSMDCSDMPPPSMSGLRMPELARQRSYGIPSILRPMQMSFSTNADQSDANGGRIPTPIYGHFASTDVNMDTSEAALNSFIHSAGRLQLRHSHNVLSPMLSEDGESEAEWWRRRRLPSPTGSPVTSQRMDTDGLNSPTMMDALSFDNIRTHDSEMDHGIISSPALSVPAWGSARRGHAMFERSSDTRCQAPRRGRLVMGIRADCEKCLKRVPGHYSHIVWE